MTYWNLYCVHPVSFIDLEEVYYNLIKKFMCLKINCQIHSLVDKSWWDMPLWLIYCPNELIVDKADEYYNETIGMVDIVILVYERPVKVLNDSTFQ